MIKKLEKLWKFKKKNRFSKEDNKNELPFYPCWYTYGDHLYRKQGERVDVSFVNTKTGKHKLLVDGNGYIVDFPGIVEGPWISELSRRYFLQPVVRFRSEFSKYDKERYMMLWQIQPDGRYWADDDGYGMTIDDEIMLYAFINNVGKFMGPFQIYRVGNKQYFHRPESDK